MSIHYDRKSKDPTYFIQIGFRNGKKTSTRNVSRIGKHSELLAQGIEDPLSYARQKVAQANEQQKNGRKSPYNMSEDKKMPETLILQGILALIFYPTVEDGIVTDT